jgi:hypothetical protein
LQFLLAGPGPSTTGCGFGSTPHLIRIGGGLFTEAAAVPEVDGAGLIVRAEVDAVARGTFEQVAL